jgi:hypothetical protein
MDHHPPLSAFDGHFLPTCAYSFFELLKTEKAFESSNQTWTHGNGSDPSVRLHPSSDPQIETEN